MNSNRRPDPIDIWHSTLTLAGVALLAMLVYRLAAGSHIDWPATLSAIANISTAVGVVAGSWWALETVKRQRTHQVRTEIVHNVQFWALGDAVYVRVGVTIRNCGQVVVNPIVATTEIQLPPTEPPSPYDQPDNSWQTLQAIAHPVSDDGVVIEPNESETYWHDVLVPEHTSYLQVSTTLTCEGDDDTVRDETTLIAVPRMLPKAALDG